MMKNTMKNLVLTAAAVTVMLAGLAPAAIAEEVRDHRDDGASNVGIIADPVREPAEYNEGIIADPVRDPAKDNVGIIVDPVREPAKDNEGIIADPVRDPGDNSDAPKDKSGAAGSVQAGKVFEEITPTDKEKVSAQEKPLILETATASGVPLSPEDGQGDDATVYGCPGGYEYDEDADTCMPVSFGFFGPLFGDGTCCYSVGEGIAWYGQLPADILKVTGAGWNLLLGDVGDTLSNWGEEIGGPLGWPLEGLGEGISFTGEVVGGVVGGLGQVVGYASDGVGEVVDSVVDAAEDAWDEISSWF